MSRDARTLRLIIDRIEGECAVVLDGTRAYDLPLSWLPEDAAEGTSLELTIRRAAQPDGRGGRVAGLLERLTADDDGGDITL
jgi:hypothetical protein